MRVVKLRDPGHMGDPMFHEVNNERRDHDTTLGFYQIECPCGASGLYVIEAAHERTADWFSHPDETQNPSVHTVDLKCPAECGASCRIALAFVHPYHGYKLRLLESWRRDVRVEGLSEPVSPNDKPAEARRGADRMRTYYNPSTCKYEINIHLEVDEHYRWGTDPYVYLEERVYHLIHRNPRSWLP